MSDGTLEQRVARLENLIGQLVFIQANPQARPKDWRRTIGMFDGDPVMKEIIDEALKLRDEDRRQVSNQDPLAEE